MIIHNFAKGISQKEILGMLKKFRIRNGDMVVTKGKDKNKEVRIYCSNGYIYVSY